MTQYISAKPCPVAGWTTLQHGQITCTNGIVYPSECKFQCDPGYEVIQPADNIDVTSVLVTCTSDGKWSLAEPPLCRKVKCLQNVTELQQVSSYEIIFDNAFDFKVSAFVRHAILNV